MDVWSKPHTHTHDAGAVAVVDGSDDAKPFMNAYSSAGDVKVPKFDMNTPTHTSLHIRKTNKQLKCAQLN